MTKSTVAAAENADAPIDPALRHFDELPDSALVSTRVVADLRNCSIVTVYRHVRSGVLPKPIKSGGLTRFRVGDLRSA